MLTDENFLLYAANNYDNPFNINEFNDDIKRFSYLKRLFHKYQETGDIKEQLIINHLVILYNMFGQDATTKMLFLKLKNYLSILKPFLIYMNRLPDVIYNVDGKNLIYTSDINMDTVIINILREKR